MAKSVLEDEFEIKSITRDTLNDGISVIIKSYFADEGVSRGVRLLESLEATKEVATLMGLIAEDGLSLVAIEKQTEKVVGAYFIKLQAKNKNEKTFFAEYRDRCKHPSSKKWVDIMNYGATFSTVTNLFELCKTNCYSEGVCVAVLQDYRGKGIATKLNESWIEMTKSLKNGTNSKFQSLDWKTLVLEGLTIPTAMTGVVTEAGNYRILRKMGFNSAASLKYSSLSYEGVSFDKVVRAGNNALKVVYQIL